MENRGIMPQSTTETVSQPRYEFDSTVHKWMFDNDEILLEIENKLRGRIYDTKQKSWVQVMQPLLNEQGINMMIYLLNFYTSKIFSLSNFTKEEIKYTVWKFDEDLILLVGTDADKYGIEENNLSMINRIMQDAIYATQKKAEGGLGIGLIRDTQKTVETIGERKSGFNLPFVGGMFGGSKKSY